MTNCYCCRWHANKKKMTEANAETAGRSDAPTHLPTHPSTHLPTPSLPNGSGPHTNFLIPVVYVTLRQRRSASWCQRRSACVFVVLVHIYVIWVRTTIITAYSHIYTYYMIPGTPYDTPGMCTVQRLESSAKRFAFMVTCK